VQRQPRCALVGLNFPSGTTLEGTAAPSVGQSLGERPHSPYRFPLRAARHGLRRHPCAVSGMSGPSSHTPRARHIESCRRVCCQARRRARDQVRRGEGRPQQAAQVMNGVRRPGPARCRRGRHAVMYHPIDTMPRGATSASGGGDPRYRRQRAGDREQCVGVGPGGLVGGLVDPARLSLAEHPRLRPVALLGSTRILPWTVVPGYEGLVRQVTNEFGLRAEDIDVAREDVAPKPGASVVLFPYDFGVGVVAAAERLDARCPPNSPPTIPRRSRDTHPRHHRPPFPGRP
jgi:hypothetical protein